MSSQSPSADVQSCVDKIFSLLSSVGVSSPSTSIPVTYHPPVTSVESHHSSLQSLSPSLLSSSVLTKSLFLKDKKTKRLHLVCVPHDVSLNLKGLCKTLSASELRFVDASDMAKVLKVPVGGVSPLCVANVEAKDASNVAVSIPKTLLAESKSLLVHPLTNEATMALTAQQITSVVEKCGFKINGFELSADVLQAPGEGKERDGASKPKAEKPKEDKLKEKTEKPKESERDNKEKEKSGESGLGLDKKKNVAFAKWYSQVVTRSEMIEYYDISGCYILRPWSFSIWESIQTWFDAEIKKLGVKNSYFPLFVSQRALCKEESHIEGFAAEVAWVTKSGQTDLDQPIAVRPTSETIMYPAFAKWIHSHRDLPLKLNQWSNVVRWEFKFPTPFIRSREFLWQEGHSAHANEESAMKEVYQILDLYANVYEDLLCVPVVKGRKTEVEKFAGGNMTTTVETFIPAVGRACQGATSHNLGLNFAKMFGIEFEDEHKEKKFANQNSYGLTTRTIGVMVMVHGDDKGLVLPPRVAPIQVVIVPILFKDPEAVLGPCRVLVDKLKAAGFRVELDDRMDKTPGFKFNHWELRGVPIRLNVGPKDIEASQCILYRRDRDDSKSGTAVKWDGLVSHVQTEMDSMQKDMLQKARLERDSRRDVVTTWEQFLSSLDRRNTVLAPHCDVSACEKDIKKRSGEAAKEDRMMEDGEDDGGEITDVKAEKLTGAAKSLCIPFDQPDLPNGSLCVGCGKRAKHWTLFGRSY